MSFSDSPSYLTSLGRSLIGGTTGIGPISLADMTSMTGDTISAFVGPALGIKNARSLDRVVASHPYPIGVSHCAEVDCTASASTAALEVPAPTGAFGRRRSDRSRVDRDALSAFASPWGGDRRNPRPARTASPPVAQWSGSPARMTVPPPGSL